MRKSPRSARESNSYVGPRASGTVATWSTRAGSPETEACCSGGFDLELSHDTPLTDVRPIDSGVPVRWRAMVEGRARNATDQSTHLCIDRRKINP